jgi:hypothetical protein
MGLSRIQVETVIPAISHQFNCPTDLMILALQNVKALEHSWLDRNLPHPPPSGVYEKLDPVFDTENTDDLR